MHSPQMLCDCPSHIEVSCVPCSTSSIYVISTCNAQSNQMELHYCVRSISSMHDLTILKLVSSAPHPVSKAFA